MLQIKSRFRYMMPLLFLPFLPLTAEETNHYIASDVIVSVDRQDDDKKSQRVDMFAGYERENWYVKGGLQMQKDIFDFAGNIGLKDSYFKNHPIQIGSTLEAYYHIKFIKVNEFEQNMFVAASYFVDLVPSDTRVTVYFGAGLKGNYLVVDSSNPPQWNAYPILSLFVTQNFSRFLTVNVGLRTFSYFVSTAFIEPQFFASLDFHITPQFTVHAGVEGIYNSYRRLEDLKDNTDTLELQTINVNAGIKYNF